MKIVFTIKVQKRNFIHYLYIYGKLYSLSRYRNVNSIHYQDTEMKTVFVILLYGNEISFTTEIQGKENLNHY